MSNSAPPKTGLTRIDYLFTGLILAFFAGFYFVFKIGFVLKLDQNTNVVKFVILGFQIALVSALTLACFYAYQLTKNTSYYYLSYCWAAHAAYKIFTIIPTPESSQLVLTGIIALIADLPLFLSSFPKEKRQIWVPIIPISGILLTVIVYFDVFLVLGNTEKKQVIYLVGPIQSILILMWLTFSTFRYNLFGTTKNLSNLFAITFFVLAVSQVPYVYFESLCQIFNPLNPGICKPDEMLEIILKILSLLIFALFLGILFFVVKKELSGIHEEKYLAQEQLKVKGEFEILGYLAASIEHELRTPLEVVKRQVRKLNKQIENNKDLGELFSYKFQKLENEVYKVSAAANVINILRLERSAFTSFLEDTIVIERINSAIKRVKVEFPQWSDKMSLVITEKTKDLHVQAYFPYLEQVFLNILKNSYESFTSDANSQKSNRGTIEILIDTKDNREKVIIEFKDNGPGFDLNDISKLTRPDYTKKLSSTKTNRGIGLFVCDKVVYLHNGQINFSNSVTGGAVVRLEFPRYITKREAINSI